MRTYEFIDAIIAHCSERFPRSCERCGRAYHSMKDHFEHTGFVGAPALFGIERDEEAGIFAFANCICGAPLHIDCRDDEAATCQALKRALELDCDETGMPPEQILAGLRIAVRQRVLTRENSVQHLDL